MDAERVIEWGMGWEACRRAAARKVATLADDCEDALNIVEGLDVDWGAAESQLVVGGQFDVVGQPCPQPRPKIVRMGKRCHTCGLARDVRAVSNAGKAGRRSQAWRELVAAAARSAGVTPIDGPLALELAFRLAPAPSLLRKSGELRPSARQNPVGSRDGDVDNLAKGTIDSLHGILFDSDSSVLALWVRKEWALGTDPGCRVRWAAIRQ